MSHDKTAVHAEYEALVSIDHTKDHCIYPAGASVRLDHLPKEQIQRLIDRGYVRLIVRPLAPPDVSNEGGR